MLSQMASHQRRTNFLVLLRVVQKNCEKEKPAGCHWTNNEDHWSVLLFAIHSP